MKKEKEVNELLDGFSWDNNTEESRKEFADKLTEIFGFKFIDDSEIFLKMDTIEDYLKFLGYDSQTNRGTIISVSRLKEEGLGDEHRSKFD